MRIKPIIDKTVLSDSFIEYILTCAITCTDKKLILDNKFIDVCNQLYTDISDSFVSAVWGIDGATNTNYLNDKQRITWTVSLFTRKVFQSLTCLINCINIDKVYCTFDIDIDEKDEDIEEELIPSYLICNMLSELDVEIIAENKIKELIKTIK